MKSPNPLASPCNANLPFLDYLPRHQRGTFVMELNRYLADHPGTSTHEACWHLFRWTTAHKFETSQIAAAMRDHSEKFVRYVAQMIDEAAPTPEQAERLKAHGLMTSDMTRRRARQILDCQMMASPANPLPVPEGGCTREMANYLKQLGYDGTTPATMDAAWSVVRKMTTGKAR